MGYRLYYYILNIFKNMDNIDKLAEAIATHKKECFHKNTCRVCKVPGVIEYNLVQCDYCGELCHTSYITMFNYRCRCLKNVKLIVCEECNVEIFHYDIVKHPSECGNFYGIYINDCCPLVKGVTSK